MKHLIVRLSVIALLAAGAFAATDARAAHGPTNGIPAPTCGTCGR